VVASGFCEERLTKIKRIKAPKEKQGKEIIIT